MKIVFSDFDGTLTNNGHLSAIFFDILELIKKNDSELIVVSGRSLSWGHFLLTHFDMKYCIMEGGGVLLRKNGDREIIEEILISDEELAALEDKTTRLLRSVEGVVLSSDSYGRKTDRAIEFFQMEDAAIREAELFMEQEGLKFTRSNVHLNFWIGKVSKYNAIEHLIKHHMPHIDLDETIFFGDALNDESVFEKLCHTVGVSNIQHCIDSLRHHPKLVLEGDHHIGAHGVYAHLQEVFK